jgi:hypothetical protein
MPSAASGPSLAIGKDMGGSLLMCQEPTLIRSYYASRWPGGDGGVERFPVKCCRLPSFVMVVFGLRLA